MNAVADQFRNFADVVARLTISPVMRTAAYVAYFYIIWRIPQSQLSQEHQDAFILGHLVLLAVFVACLSLRHRPLWFLFSLAVASFAYGYVVVYEDDWTITLVLVLVAFIVICARSID